MATLAELRDNEVERERDRMRETLMLLVDVRCPNAARALSDIVRILHQREPWLFEDPTHD